jgi:arylsulfatase A-like enzyme
VCATGLLSALGNGLIAPLPREPAILRHLYKAGVRSTDSELGRLFADLQAMGLYDDLLVIVTSDHGEMLLEHGAVLHGTFWEEVLHVPLIVKWPGNARAGTLTQRRTSAMDLVPTLLAVAGLPADPDLPGRDLRSPDRRSVLANIGPWLAVYDGSLKALVNDAENHQLYDVAADPGETRDLAAERPADLARLVAAATAWKESEERRLGRFERHPDEGGAVTLTPEEEERLRALGYLGGAR